MNLIDTHCHITSSRFDEDRDLMIARMHDAGLVNAVVVADPAEDGTVDKVRALAEEHNFLYWTCGVHPENADKWSDETEAVLRRSLGHPKCLALGEIGLDYYWKDNPERNVQKATMIAQLKIAYELGKPAVLHVRDSHGDVTDVLTQAKAEGYLPQIILHCYSGSWESAKTYLSMGAYLSFTGPITFPNAAKNQEVATKMPVDRLLVETDCPFLAPVPFRGKRNEPAYVAYTLKKIAELRGMDADELADITTANAKRVFCIPE